MINSKENIINPENQTGENLDLSPQASPEISPESNQELNAPSAPEIDSANENPAIESENLTPQDLSPETEAQPDIQNIAVLPQNEKLWELKQMAKKDLDQAVSIAKKLNDPWLEDQFHDELMNDPELRAQLEATGKIESL